MSISKTTSKLAAAPAKSAPKAAAASQAKPGAKGAKSAAPAAKDCFQKTEELKNEKSGKAGHPKDSARLGEEKATDKKADKDCHKAEKDGQANLSDKVKDLEKQLQELKQAPAQSSPSGGESCGGGEAQSAGQAQDVNGNKEQDPNQELQILAIAILSQRLQGPQQQQQPGAGGDLQGALTSKCEQLKGKGFQPAPETKQLVAAAIGTDFFSGEQNKTGPACGKQGQVQPFQQQTPVTQNRGQDSFGLGLVMTLGRGSFQ